MAADTGGSSELDTHFGPGDVTAWVIMVEIAAWLAVGLIWLAGLVFDVEPLRLSLWVLVLPAAAAFPVWFVVRLLRYPPGGRGLVVGAAFLAVTGAAALPLLEPAPVPPAGTPAEVAAWPVGSVAPATADAVRVYREDDGLTSMQIEFPGFEALNGLWAYSTATVVAPNLPTIIPPPRPHAWDNKIRVSSIETITPTYLVDLPLTAEMDHTTLTFTATMYLQYPTSALGSTPATVLNGFTDKVERLSRDIKVFVASPADAAFSETLADWRAGRAAVDHYTVGLGLFGLVGLVMVGTGLWYAVRAGGRGPTRAAP